MEKSIYYVLPLYYYTTNEIKQVREILYLFAEIQINAEKQLIEDEKCDIIL